MKMQTCCRFIEDEERWLLLFLSSIEGQFDALVFSSGQRRGRLS